MCLLLQPVTSLPDFLASLMEQAGQGHRALPSRGSR